jgi:protein-S-isoprenylcysteine O-methyltransferase Ste14
MGHRTQDLPPLGGLAATLRELRYHEPSRQSFAVLLILLYTATAEPARWLLAIGLPLAIIGQLIRLHASGFVLKNKELATNGPYALMRHPLYTGNIVLVTGFAVANARWWGLPVAALFFWFYYPPAIDYEDRKLHRLFGDTWERWARETPALLPRVSRIGGLFSGQWSFAKSTKHNGEIFIALYVLVCLAYVISALS